MNIHDAYNAYHGTLVTSPMQINRVFTIETQAQRNGALGIVMFAYPEFMPGIQPNFMSVVPDLPVRARAQISCPSTKRYA